MGWLGHYRTIGSLARRTLRPAPEPPGSRPWSGTAPDETVGPIKLSGVLNEPPGSRYLVILVHGLGGSVQSGYLIVAAGAAYARGIATLRLNLRGADNRGEDLYHAGLTDDVHAAVASPALRRYPRIGVMGYSLGGHVALTFAGETRDARVSAVAAICSPLDLAAGTRLLDGWAGLPYRRYLLPRLVRTAARVVERGRVSPPEAPLSEIRTIRQFDELLVAPRHGFSDADDYYAKASVGSKLHALVVPGLLVVGGDDPMVPPRSVRRMLETVQSEKLEVRWVERGGHLGFAHDLDLGERGSMGADEQVLSWLERQGAGNPSLVATI